MIVEVQVHTNSRRPRVSKDSSGLFHIYVSELPIEGKANEAVREALAFYFEVGRSKVQLIRGEKSKRKLFNILK